MNFLFFIDYIILVIQKRKAVNEYTKNKRDTLKRT